MEKKDLHIRYWLITAVSYTAFFLVLFFSLRGTIAENFRNGNYAEEAADWMARRRNGETVTMDVALWSPEGMVMSEKAMEKSHADGNHLLLEALLEGPGPEELSEGLISYIPTKTELIGVTMKDGMGFVAVSKDILGSSDLDRAYQQIKNTLSAGNPGMRVALIVDGEIIIS